MTGYQKLEQHYAKIRKLEHCQNILSFYQRQFMPKGAAESRSEESAEISSIIHQLHTEPRIKDWIYEAEKEELTDRWQSANLKEIKHVHEVKECLPLELVEKMSNANNLLRGKHPILKRQNDWKTYQKLFKDVVKYSREKGKILSDHFGGTPYDHFLNSYQQGVNTKQVDELFDDLTDFLPSLIEKMSLRRQKEMLNTSATPEQQGQLAEYVAHTLGLNFDNARVYLSSNSSCTGSPDDVIVRTRYDVKNFNQLLRATCHEVGHGLYRYNRPRAHITQPVGEPSGMLINEGIALLFERNIGFHKDFRGALAPTIRSLLNRESDDDKQWSAESFHQSAIQVNPQELVRINASEPVYPCHIIWRYNIERDLINSKIEVDDIPEIWNENTQAFLALQVEDGDYRHGCMQDIHWSKGAFGYFPMYTLGAIFACQLMEAMAQKMDVSTTLAAGDLTPINKFLKENVWSLGRLLPTNELIEYATGHPLSTKAYKEHLQARYLRDEY